MDVRTRRLRPLALALALAGAGCVDDTQALLAEGRVLDACLRSRTRDDERAQLRAWLVERAPVTVRGLDASVVEEALGGPLRGYGSEVGVYDVKVAVVDSDPRIAVRLEVQEGLRGRALSTLVDRLPPLAVPERAPRVPAIDPRSLVPAPRPRGRPNDPIGAVIEAGVTLAAAPFVAVGAVMGGIADALGAIFGGARRGGTRSTGGAVPIELLEVTDAARADALFDEAEVSLPQAELQRAHDALDAAVRAERDRRVALLVPSLLDPGDCRAGACRVLRDDRPWPASRSVDVRLRRETWWGEERCGVGYEAPVVLERPAAKAPRSGDENTALQNAWRTKAADAAHGVRVLEPLPAYALRHSAALPERHRLSAAQRSPHIVDAIADLHCQVDANDGDLTARVVVGHARSRVTSRHLGRARAATFVVHDVHLQRGEGLRLSVASRGRSLGADVVPFDGRLPLRLRSGAFRATCARLEEPLDATAALAAADRALDAFDNGEKDRRTWSKRRQQAEVAVVAAAALAGYNDPAVAQRVQRLGR